MECIVPECYGDTILIKTIFAGKSPKHQKGIANVKITMNALALKYPVVVGVMDNDKKEQYFFNQLICIKDYGLFEHRIDGNKHFIILKPALEKFLIDSCKEANINLNEYFHVNNDPKKLGKYLKSSYISNAKNYTNLIANLLNVKESKLGELKTAIEGVFLEYA
jgi:hypothetical protein